MGAQLSVNRQVNQRELSTLSRLWFENRPAALLIVSPSLAVLSANRLAEDFLEAGDALMVRNGALVAANREDQKMLETLGPSGRTVKRMLAFRSVTGLPALLARADPLSNGHGHAMELSRAGSLFEYELPDFTHLFGLTPAEAALVLPLLRGDTPAEIAEGRQISLETVRSHLKNAFAKLGVSGRSEFVGRVLEFLG